MTSEEEENGESSSLHERDKEFEDTPPHVLAQQELRSNKLLKIMKQMGNEDHFRKLNRET